MQIAYGTSGIPWVRSLEGVEVLESGIGELKATKSEDELVREFYQKLVVDEFVTKNVIDNDKIALESHIGNVRIGVDINIRTTNRAEGFLEPEITAMPLDSARTLVLKVKYDRQLQEPLRSIVGYGLAR